MHMPGRHSNPKKDVAAALSLAVTLGSSFRLTPTSQALNDRKCFWKGLYRFLTRMSTRPTPFGLFAGVGLAKWGRTTNLTISSPHRHSRPDMEWLSRLLAHSCEAIPEVRECLDLTSNQAIVEIGDRLAIDDCTVLFEANSGEAQCPFARQSQCELRYRLHSTELHIEKLYWHYRNNSVEQQNLLSCSWTS